MPNYYRLFAVWIGLNIIDAISTYVALQGNSMELNPLVNLAARHFQLAYVLIAKVFLAALIGIFVLKWNPRLIFVLNILMSCVVVLTTISALTS